MILLTHIIVALTSLVCAAAAFLYPSRAKLNASYATVALTLISGTYLVISKPAHLTQTCAEGLVYLGIVSFGIIMARQKLLLKKI